ncbi:MAG: hypothetical protein AMXMBFR33_05060 [Candidatus Xenobia bacterium]
MRRGLTLIAVVWFLAMATVFFMGSRALVDQFRYRQASQKYRLQARAMAESGLEFARLELRAGRWQGQRFRSPNLEGGWFEIWREGDQIRVKGCSGRAVVELP